MSYVIRISKKYEKPIGRSLSKYYEIVVDPFGYFLRMAYPNNFVVCSNPQDARQFETDRDALKKARRLRAQVDMEKINIDILELSDVEEIKEKGDIYVFPIS